MHPAMVVYAIGQCATLHLVALQPVAAAQVDCCGFYFYNTQPTQQHYAALNFVFCQHWDMPQNTAPGGNATSS